MSREQQRIALQPAYVLHRRPYKDSKALIDLLTPEYGRLTVVASGVHSNKSQRKALLQPFYPLLISWMGRGELFTLTKAEPQGAPLNIHPAELMLGFYINELLFRLLSRFEANIELFGFYDLTLRELARTPTNNFPSNTVQAILRRFEIRLLENLGYGLILDHDVDSNEPIDPSLVYDYQLNRGPVANRNNRHFIGVEIQGSSLLNLAKSIPDSLIADKNFMLESKYLLRYVLNYYLGEKPLLSRQLYQNIAKNKLCLVK